MILLNILIFLGIEVQPSSTSSVEIIGCDNWGNGGDTITDASGEGGSNGGGGSNGSGGGNGEGGSNGGCGGDGGAGGIGGDGGIKTKIVSAIWFVSLKTEYWRAERSTPMPLSGRTGMNLNDLTC